MKKFCFILAATGSLQLMAAIGPDYVPPTIVAPAHYKGTNDSTWKVAEPKTLDNTEWWRMFEDPILDHLLAQAESQSPTLKAALARVDQARATARIARSYWFPDLTINPSASRQRTSPNIDIPFPANGASFTGNNFNVPLDLSYELDIWGRVRRGFESVRAEAEASVAGYETVRLTLRSDIAINYFGLRALDLERQTVRDTVQLRREALDLIRRRVEDGFSNELDLARAETELATTEAELAAINQRRAELENAIAVLIGANPSEFRLGEAQNILVKTPEIPSGLPSDLLERRPDIAQAERLIAAASARIGVAKAAYFPVVRLTGSGGFVSGDIETLFNWDSRTWAIGPSISIPLFAGGRNTANLRRAKSRFEESIQVYREQVLVAFREVENALSGIQFLVERAEATERAAKYSSQGAELARTRFDAGFVSYLEVVDAERIALASRRALAQVQGQRQIAVVQLVKALGGGWQRPDSRP
ncbi:MAG: efflux transporter outer membrane subunit [Verrucomicrobiota bacterium]|nr:efflux transporter outer membrane subunit [Verrucomicrobiota bacterium]